MSSSFDLIIRGGRLVSPTTTETADIGVIDGRIAEIGDLASADAETVLEAGCLHVLPGVIDSQVHMREPGDEHKEDLETGMRGAAKGGVTTVLEMPNTNPSTTSAEALADKVERARGRAYCDFGFFIGASAENADALADLEQLPGCAGVKIFMGSSTGDLLVPDDDALRRVLSSGKRRVAVHCEDEMRLQERRPIVDRPGATAALHPVWRDTLSALQATERVVAIAQDVGRPIHVLHITTRHEMEFLAGIREDGVSVECLPQHLSLAAPDCYEKLGTYAQMNPPIREAEHRDGIWKALQDGVVDVIASDHAPHTREEKDLPYPQSPSGMPGVQTLLPMMLEHVHAGRLSLNRLVELVCANPARLYGMLGKGEIKVGADADFTFVDLEAECVIEDDWIESRCGWTPYDGEKVHGWPVTTIVRGKVVMRDDELIGSPIGDAVRFSSDAG